MSLIPSASASSSAPTPLSASDFSFCIDRLFVFEEYYLNPKLSWSSLAYKLNANWTRDVFRSGINDTFSAR
jgi:hypothetical protein